MKSTLKAPHVLASCAFLQIMRRLNLIEMRGGVNFFIFYRLAQPERGVLTATADGNKGLDAADMGGPEEAGTGGIPGPMYGRGGIGIPPGPIL